MCGGMYECAVCAYLCMYDRYLRASVLCNILKWQLRVHPTLQVNAMSMTTATATPTTVMATGNHKQQPRTFIWSFPGKYFVYHHTKWPHIWSCGVLSAINAFRCHPFLFFYINRIEEGRRERELWQLAGVVVAVVEIGMTTYKWPNCSSCDRNIFSWSSRHPKIYPQNWIKRHPPLTHLQHTHTNTPATFGS